MSKAAARIAFHIVFVTFTLRNRTVTTMRTVKADMFTVRRYQPTTAVLMCFSVIAQRCVHVFTQNIFSHCSYSPVLQCEQIINANCDVV